MLVLPWRVSLLALHIEDIGSTAYLMVPRSQLNCTFLSLITGFTFSAHVPEREMHIHMLG